MKVRLDQAARPHVFEVQGQRDIILTQGGLGRWTPQQGQSPPPIEAERAVVFDSAQCSWQLHAQRPHVFEVQGQRDIILTHEGLGGGGAPPHRDRAQVLEYGCPCQHAGENFSSFSVIKNEVARISAYFFVLKLGW